MKVDFKRSFVKDLKKVRSQEVRTQVQAVIEAVERASSLAEISSLKRLTSDGAYYRVHVGDCRIGLVMDEETVVFVRFLHRREIYRYFP